MTIRGRLRAEFAGKVDNGDGDDDNDDDAGELLEE